MPGGETLVIALATAALTAALLALGWRRSTVADVVGVGLGFALGVWLLGIRPAWPPREDQDRFLLILLPAVVGVELMAFLPRMPTWLAWTLRVLVAVAAGRVLLDGTSYITDLAGPGSREWDPATMWLILGGLAMALAASWAALAALGKRAGSATVGALGLTSAAAAAAVMLSGYASGGLLGLPLAAALSGAALARLVRPAPPDQPLPVGIGVVGVFGLLVSGHFFGTLPVSTAALLAVAPLLGWLAALLPAARLGPALRGALQLLLVAGLLGTAVWRAQERFTVTAAPPGAPREATADDYSNFGR